MCKNYVEVGVVVFNKVVFDVMLLKIVGEVFVLGGIVSCFEVEIVLIW